jgi:hypothetical protein
LVVLATFFELSFTCTVNENAPAALGVPAIAPLCDSDNPVGSDPSETLQA